MPSRDEGDSQGDGRGKGMMEKDVCKKNNRERVCEMMRRGLRHKRRVCRATSVCYLLPAPQLHEVFHQGSHSSAFLPLKVSPTAW